VAANACLEGYITQFESCWGYPSELSRPLEYK
jgi:hypothetical protein